MPSNVASISKQETAQQMEMAKSAKKNPGGSQGQLHQVLLNLITNAIEAMHDITNRPRILRVRSDINKDASCVRITVEDTGIGIDDKDTEHFFEPFFTTRRSSTYLTRRRCPPPF
jgi:signal transduction histidine kinase